MTPGKTVVFPQGIFHSGRLAGTLNQVDAQQYNICQASFIGKSFCFMIDQFRNVTRRISVCPESSGLGVKISIRPHSVKIKQILMLIVKGLFFIPLIVLMLLFNYNRNCLTYKKVFWVGFFE